MSEFDKEAEREKLRKKYAEEQEDRETTQRMSELLLQGATMTNHHCDTCGDPVFRYEGQEFCPTCQASSGEAASQTHTPEQAPSSPTTVPIEESGSAEGQQHRPTADQERSDPTDTAAQSTEGSKTEDTQDRSVEGGEPTSEAHVQPVSGDLAGARDELGRTISRLARRAAESDDPRQAREFLEAAGEAAVTLETLNGR
jgi:UPF0148 protein